MVGTLAEATEALAGNLRYIGGGCFRDAYVNTDRTVVYKICNGNSLGLREKRFYTDNESNRNEYQTYVSIVDRDDIPEMLTIPEMTQYEIEGVLINALTFVEGRAANQCMPAEVYRFFRHVGLTDSGHDNVLVDRDGQYYLVDMEVYRGF